MSEDVDETMAEADCTTRQQSMEASRVGQNVISVAVAVFVLVGVGWNLPDSPIRRGLLPLLQPTAAMLNLDKSWAVFAPNPPKRRDSVEVQVQMADGTTRVWTHRRLDGLNRLATTRWQSLLARAILEPGVRPDIARWVVRQVADPSERPTSVTMILHTTTLSPPGSGSGGAPASKVLFHEDLEAVR